MTFTVYITGRLLWVLPARRTIVSFRISPAQKASFSDVAASIGTDRPIRLGLFRGVIVAQVTER